MFNVIQPLAWWWAIGIVYYMSATGSTESCWLILDCMPHLFRWSLGELMYNTQAGLYRIKFNILIFFVETDFQQTIKPSFQMKATEVALLLSISALFCSQNDKAAQLHCATATGYNAIYAKVFIDNDFMRYLCSLCSHSSPSLWPNFPQSRASFSLIQFNPTRMTGSDTRRESARLRGWSAGLGGGEWSPCWAARLSSAEEARPAKDILMRDTWKAAWPALLIQHTQCDDSLKSIVLHTPHIIKSTNWSMVANTHKFLLYDGAARSECACFPAIRQQQYITWIQKH